jgi:tetratricopeptide repeat protein
MFATVAESRIDELRRRIDRDPGSRLFAQLAEEYRKAGSHADAIRVARNGLAQHPSYTSARLTLGRALLESGDPAGARAELEAALKDAPDNILASRFLGQALEALGELAPALEQLQKTLKMAPGDRQLESQIVSLQTRLRSPQPAAAAAPRAPAPPPAARPQPPAAPPDVPAAAWTVNAPMARPAAPVAPADLPEPLPPTIRIRPLGESWAWARKSAVPPPLPGTAAPTSAAPVGPPPLPAAVSPLAVTERLPASTSAIYESDVAPTLPPAPGSPFGLVDETAVPTLPPGAVTAEETVLEPEPAFEAPAGPLLAEAQPRPELRLVPERPQPPEEAPARRGPPAPSVRPVEPAAARPGPTTAAEPGPGEEGGTPGTPFPSSTLAELYLKQGLVERAVEVYRQLLAEEPGNQRARARLAGIERMPSPEAARGARRRALERTIAGLEALLVVVQRR